MKTAKFFTRKEVIRGEKGYRLIGWENIAEKESLPTKYLIYSQNRFYNGPASIITNKGSDLYKDQFYSLRDWEERVKFLKDAGNELHLIMDEVRKAEAEWKGEETFVI